MVINFMSMPLNASHKNTASLTNYAKYETIYLPQHRGGRQEK